MSSWLTPGRFFLRGTSRRHYSGGHNDPYHDPRHFMTPDETLPFPTYPSPRWKTAAAVWGGVGLSTTLAVVAYLKATLKDA